MKKLLVLSLAVILTSSCVAQGGVQKTNYAPEDKVSRDLVTDDDRDEVQRFFAEDWMGSFVALMQGDSSVMSGLLTDDVRLRWIKKEADGSAAFIDSVVQGIGADAKYFAIAVANYKFLEIECGIKEPSRRPVGLPSSVDLATFDPANITPEDMAAHPGLMAPYVEPIKNLQGMDLAADRFINVSKFRHNWMAVSDEAYLYVDRFIVVKEDNRIKIVEYEFTANLDELPDFPELLTECP